jgi:hypothetical protein
MNKNYRVPIILAAIVTLSLFFLSSCNLFPFIQWNPFVREGKLDEAEDLVDELIEDKSSEEAGSEDQPVGDESESETTDSEEEITEARKASFNFSDTHRALGALDRFTNYIGLLPIDKEKIQLISEPEGDNIHFLTDIEPEMYRLESDIIFSGSFILEIDPEYTGLPLEALFPCSNYSPDIPARVLCGEEEEQAEPVLEWYVPFFVVAEDIPQESELDNLQIAAVFDMDGDPANNHQAHEMAAKDFWQGGDTAYAMNYTPQSGWDYQLFKNSPEGFTADSTGSIAVVQENLVVWLIPGTETEVLIPEWLGSIHISDEYFSPESTGANTTNSGDPTLGLVSFDPVTRISIYKDPKQQEHSIPAPYEICAWIGCIPKFEQGVYSSENLISCECSGCTYDPDCDCHIFEWNTMSMAAPIGVKVWDYAIEGKHKYPMQMYHRYECFCVKVSE